MRLLGGVFVVAATVTAVLSLDATVVLLTPVVVGGAVALGTSSRPGAYACLRMANSASLLLPVSNLTNLLAMPHLDLTFAGFALVMAPVLAVVLVVEYVVLRVLFRRTSRPRPQPTTPRLRARCPRVPLVAVALMLVGFAVLSPFGVEPGWVSAVAAVALVAWGRRHGLTDVRRSVHAAHPSFALFVLSLGVVVAAMTDGLPRRRRRRARARIHVVPGPARHRRARDRPGEPAHQPVGHTLAGAAARSAGHPGGPGRPARAQHRLRADLHRVAGQPAVAPHARAARRAPGFAGFHRVSLVATPLSLLAAVGVLALVT